MMWENTAPCTAVPRIVCARIGTLQIDVVLVVFHMLTREMLIMDFSGKICIVTCNELPF